MSRLEFLTRFLDERESAPSAVCMVKSVYLGRELTDDEVDEAYNNGSEGSLDSERDHLLAIMTDAQLVELYELVVDILLEKLSDMEGDR